MTTSDGDLPNHGSEPKPPETHPCRRLRLHSPLTIAGIALGTIAELGSIVMLLVMSVDSL